LTIRKTQETIANILIDIGAVGFAPDDPKTFKSGLISPVYVDNRTIPYYPEKWQHVINGFQETITIQNINFDIVAGVAVGGIPHSAALGYAMSKPSVFIRKQAKGHGLQNRVEGGDVSGKRVLLVEDLVTTGGSSLSGVQALRDSGATIEHCIVIVRYDFPEAITNFAEANIDLHTLTTFPIIVEQAAAQGKFTDNELAVINDWLSDPHGWGKRQGYAS
jgi:orotate phosphoribosyltransferase